ncbi:MAG TPA: magnesium chelatase ATPase subunit D [Blastocatellia bacterium]
MTGLPIAAIIGQEEVKLALALVAVCPKLSGVLIRGGPGTGKTLLARSLPSIFPLANGARAHRLSRPAFVEVPFNASIGRLVGGIDIEATLASARPSFATGLLQLADHGFLFVDQINLLDVSLAASIATALDTGSVVVERDGCSSTFPARFGVIGTYDPAEGEAPAVLRDRIGLIVEAEPISAPQLRTEVIDRVSAFERHPREFALAYEQEMQVTRQTIADARARIGDVEVTKTNLSRLSAAAIQLGVDGNRVDIFAAWAAAACAALRGRAYVDDEDLISAIRLVLLPRATKQQEHGAKPEDSPPKGAALQSQTEPGSGTGFGSHSSASTGQTAAPSARKENVESDLENDSSDLSHQPAGELIVRAESGSYPAALRAVLDGPVRLSRLSGLSGGIAQSRSGGKSIPAPAESGRYVASVRKELSGKYASRKVSLDATLRAAAPLQVIRRKAVTLKPSPLERRDAPRNRKSGQSERGRLNAPPKNTRIIISPDDLRFKQFKRKNGTLFILVVDSSGSMAVGRLGQAKGTLIHLLQKAYLARDTVALVAFRGSSAEVLLPPSRSIALAKRLVESMPAGGGTPLAAGIRSGLAVARNARRKDARRAMLVLFTDGRANVGINEATVGGGVSKEDRQATIVEELRSIGLEIAKEDIASVVVDTSPSFLRTGKALAVSKWIGARYLFLPRADPQAISAAVRECSEN